MNRWRIGFALAVIGAAGVWFWLTRPVQPGHEPVGGAPRTRSTVPPLAIEREVVGETQPIPLRTFEEETPTQTPVRLAQGVLDQRFIDVSVVDLEGKPVARVPVAIFAPGQREGDQNERLGTGDPTQTNALGRARLPISARDREEQRAGRPLHVDFVFPYLSPASAMSLPPEGSVTLTMPPVGRVKCLFVMRDGTPLRKKSNIQLLHGAEDDRVPARGGVADGWTRGEHFTFPYCGVGGTVRVLVGHGRFMTSQVAPGPSAEGSEAEVVFRLDPEDLEVQAMLRLSSGELPARTEVRCVLPDPGSSGPSRYVLTAAVDEGGLWRAPLSTIPAPWPLGEVVRFEVGLGPIRGVASVRLPEQMGEGTLDLGELTLVVDTPLIEGVVVDPAGEPVPGAEVHIAYPGPEWVQKGEDLMVLAREHAAMSATVTITTPDANGRFSVFASPDVTRMGLEATRRGAEKGRAVLCRAHDRGVRLVTGAITGGLRGSVIVREGGSSGILVTAAHEALDRSGQSRAYLDDQGAFDLHSLSPGNYTVGVGFASEGMEASAWVSIPGVVVRAGEVSQDPRLQAIAMPESIRAIQLEVVGTEGGQVDELEVYLLAPGMLEAVGESGTHSARLDRRRGAHRFRLRNGRTMLLMEGSEGRDLEVAPSFMRASLFRPLFVRGVTADLRVTMNLSVRVVIAVVQDEGLAILGGRLIPTLTRRASDTRGDTELAVAHDPSRLATDPVSNHFVFGLPTSGPWTLQWMVASAATRSRQGLPASDPPVILEVQALVSHQEFQVTASEDILKAARTLLSAEGK